MTLPVHITPKSKRLLPHSTSGHKPGHWGQHHPCQRPAQGRWLLENHPHPHNPTRLRFFPLFLHEIEDGIAADDFVDGVDQEEEAAVLLPDADRVSRPNLQPAPSKGGRRAGGDAQWCLGEERSRPPGAAGGAGQPSRSPRRAQNTRGFISQLAATSQLIRPEPCRRKRALWGQAEPQS